MNQAGMQKIVIGGLENKVMYMLLTGLCYREIKKRLFLIVLCYLFMHYCLTTAIMYSLPSPGSVGSMGASVWWSVLSHHAIEPL